jgi:hypothetical protein
MRSDGSVLSDDLRRALANDHTGRHGIAGVTFGMIEPSANAQTVDAIDAKIPIYYRYVVPAQFGRAGIMPERHGGVTDERFQLDIADRLRTGLTLR